MTREKIENLYVESRYAFITSDQGRTSDFVWDHLWEIVEKMDDDTLNEWLSQQEQDHE